jgi:DNA-binding HxlR family transcriptional regulator
MATAEDRRTTDWRRYRDACGTAQGLDIVGERWTLLVVRELLLGPKRFTDLRGGLPGISTNILADRLETLELSGVVRRRTLPAPAASKVYELADWGRDLEQVVAAIGRWGVRSPWRSEEDAIGVDGLMVSFRTMFDPEAAGDLEARYEVVLGGQAFGIEVKDGASGSTAARRPTRTRGSRRTSTRSPRSSTKGVTSTKPSGPGTSRSKATGRPWSA